MISRRVVTIAEVLLIAGGLAVSHLIAYQLGRNAAWEEAREVRFATIQHPLIKWLWPAIMWIAMESEHNLRTSVKAMRAAVKSPNAFEDFDLREIRHAAKVSLADLDRMIIPAIRSAEEKEREVNPQRTKKDEEDSIAHVREIAREAQELEAQLAKLLDKP
jgi:hypothetical protein